MEAFLCAAHKCSFSPKSKTAKGREAAPGKTMSHPIRGWSETRPSPYFSTDPKMPKGRLSRPFVG
jgi:hypothetical protein